MKTKRLLSLLFVILMMFTSLSGAFAATEDPATCTHRWNDWQTDKKATCTQKGKKHRTCSICGKVQTASIAAKGHAYGEWVRIEDATCTKEGKRKRTCSRCGDVQVDSIAKKDHSYGEWVRIQEPTANTAGLEQRTCGKCGHTQERNIYPDGTLYRGGDNNRDDVRELQEMLNEQGYDCGRPDGVFGKNTEAAVENFQNDRGLTPDGVVWPETQAVLGEFSEPDNEPKVSPDEENEVVSANLSITILSGEGPYKAGETIALDIIINNDGTVPLCSPRLADALTVPENGTVHFGEPMGLGGDPVIIQPDSSFTIGYDYTVAEAYIAEGSIRFDFYCLLKQLNHENDGDFKTNDCYVAFNLEDEGFDWVPPTVGEEPDGEVTAVPDIFVWKSVTSSPQTNDAYYTLGETITYEIGVQNNSDVATPALEIYDPLHGNNEDATVALQEIIEPRQSKTYSFSHTVTQEDVDRGYVENTAEVVWWDAQTNDWAKKRTNTVAVPTTPLVKSLELKKEEISTPENGTAYVLGETIQYKITIINHADEPTGPLFLEDLMEEHETSSSYLMDVPSIGAGESWSCEYNHVVTEREAEKGDALNLAWVSRIDDPWHCTYSEWVESKVVQIGDEETPPYTQIEGIEVINTEVSTPQNGSFYVADEVIVYLIRIVNNSAFDINAVSIYDSLNIKEDTPTGYLGTISTIAAGSEYTYYHFYPVSQQDTANEMVSNQASITYSLELEKGSAYSNWVDSPAGKELPETSLSTSGEISLLKETANTPANGSYFTEGETILYNITLTNGTDHAITDVSFFDVLELPDEPSGTIAHLDALDAGQTHSILIGYPVTKNDVDEGWVYNQAYVSFFVDNVFESVYSNWVSSPTGESGTPNPPAGNFAEGKINTPVLEGDTCARTLDAKGAYTAEYALHRCEIHETIRLAVESAVAEADTPEAKLLAWNEARTLWSDNLNEMYQSCTDHAEGAAIATVANEKAMFYAQLTAYETALTLIYPNDPEIVAEKVAEALMNKCIDMCYVLHTAPEARVDSVLRDGITPITNDSASEEDCAAIILEENGADVRYRRTLCAVHGETGIKVNQRLEAADGARALYAAFNGARKLWLADLDELYNAWYLKADDAQRGIIAADRTTFGNYLKTEVAILGYLYPANPEIVSEIIMNEISNKTMDACMLMP